MALLISHFTQTKQKIKFVGDIWISLIGFSISRQDILNSTSLIKRPRGQLP